MTKLDGQISTKVCRTFLPMYQKVWAIKFCHVLFDLLQTMAKSACDIQWLLDKFTLVVTFLNPLKSKLTLNLSKPLIQWRSDSY